MRSKDPIPTITPIAHPGTRYSTSVSRPSCDVIVVGEVGVEEVISGVCVGRTSKEVKVIYITSLFCVNPCKIYFFTKVLHVVAA